MISGLHHIALWASDEERSVQFYQTLGFAVSSRHVRPQRGDVLLLLDCAGVTIELFIGDNHPERKSYPEAYGLRHLALKTENAAAVRQHLLCQGYCPEELRRDTYTGKAMFFVMDPDGQPIEIHE